MVFRSIDVAEGFDTDLLLCVLQEVRLPFFSSQHNALHPFVGGWALGGLNSEQSIITNLCVGEQK